MKTKMFCKRTVSLLIVLITIVSMCTVAFISSSAAETDTAATSATLPAGTKLWLKPNSNWTQDNARFACYFFNDSAGLKAWHSAFYDETQNAYWVTSPTTGSYSQFIWCRMNPANSTNDWSNKWSQTSNLTYNGTNNCYTVKDGTWDNGGGTWSTITEVVETDPPATEPETDPVTSPATEPSTTPGGSTTKLSKLYFGLKYNLRHYGAVVICTLDDDTTQEVIIKQENITGDELVTVSAYVSNWGIDEDFCIYRVEIPNNTKSVQFRVSHNSTEEEWTCVQNGDHTIANYVYEDELFAYFEYGQVHQTKVFSHDEFVADDSKEEIPDDPEIPTEPTEPSEPGTTQRIYFRDDATGWHLTDQDAKIFVKDSSNVAHEMIETIDTRSGHTLWYADVAVGSTVEFYRTSVFFDESNFANGNAANNSNYWGKWTASNRGTNTVYCATGVNNGTGTGSWKSYTVAIPGDTIENYWFGIWADTKGDGNVETAVKWFDVGDKSNYKLFLPSYVDMNAVKLYTSFTDLRINGTAFTNGSTISLTNGTKYTLTFKQTSDASETDKTGYLTVYNSTGTASMLMNCDTPLFTGLTNENINSNAWPSGKSWGEKYISEYKDVISTGGSYYFYGENGSQINTSTKLKKLKGRGNSSFESSIRVYGKYAYNITTDAKEQLAEGATKSKKWCLLANNVDHTMMRNTLVYNIADEIGLSYAPNTRLIDLYDNGNYLGAYIITEKVEYGGGNTLMGDLNNLDDANEDANPNIDDLSQAVMDNYTAPTGGTYKYQYTAGMATPADYQNYNFLLEFELQTRYENELSWFVSKRTGQAVVVKYPEIASQTEMEWIINQFDAAESAIYEGSTENLDTISKYIDVDSFVKMYLIQELTLNLDACATSYYIYNDLSNKGENGGRLTASPVWDYDWTMGAYAKGDSGQYKSIFNGSGYTDNINVCYPDQMFVKYKGLKTGADDTKYTKNNYNFQAKLANNTEFWEECRSFFTNTMWWVLADYVDTDNFGTTDAGKLTGPWLNSFKSSLNMNDARWGALTFKGDNWGTKVTSDYDDYANNGWSNVSNFMVTNNYTSGNDTSSYENTVYYLNDWLIRRLNYLQLQDVYDPSLLEFTFKEADFSGKVDSKNGTLTITPTATIIFENAELPKAQYQYTVYVDGNAVAEATNIPATTESVTFPITPGTHNVYVSVSVIAYPNNYVDTATKPFTYQPDAQVVTFTTKFKSSSSYRYQPSVSVNNGTPVAMTKGTSIGFNQANTQEYFWYTFDVTISNEADVALKFTNRYSLNATITLVARSFVQGDAYCFGVDNLNNGTEVVDLTSKPEYVQNFKQTATHMVATDAEISELATTMINGKNEILGNTDGDGDLSILDATNTQFYLAKKVDLSSTSAQLADYNLDETVSIMDVTLTQTYLAQ